MEGLISGGGGYRVEKKQNKKTNVSEQETVLIEIRFSFTGFLTL